jgi:hypothetical protein
MTSYGKSFERQNLGQQEAALNVVYTGWPVMASVIASNCARK